MSKPTFATNVIARREKDGPEPQDELAQEAGLRILEDLHSLERVQVNVNGNLRFEFVCKKKIRCSFFAETEGTTRAMKALSRWTSKRIGPQTKRITNCATATLIWLLHV